MDAMHLRHSPEQCRLNICASKTNLKAAFLHKGNNLISIPVVYAPNPKETYTSTNNFVAKVAYKKYQWDICGDFKVIAVLLGCKPAKPNILLSCVSEIAVSELPTILGNIDPTDNP